ncbi:MAG: cysteine--tRNA ligase [Selenomonadaceae bacterium]|nr:cysteine--tRNA ligase [Selenomonadaceae bacterium]
MKLLIDSNVILDYILEREPFFEMAKKVLNLSENDDDITEFISASAVTDINYIAYRTLKNRDLVYILIRKVLKMVEIAPVTDKEITNALDLNWKDFEDAVQYSVALSNNIDAVVTRNMKGFSQGEVKICTPEEILDFIDKKNLEAEKMIQVYNTMTKRKEIFKPLKDGEISIYCCGVTPYNAPHIGNARPFVTWDVIRRYFSRLGYKVRYVQNFTDIDDKIINAANAEGVTWKEIADRYIEIYFHSMDALNIQHADIYPKVSDTMPDIIKMIETLLEKGYAYKLDNGDVFYSIEKYQSYGRLSGRSLEDMQAGARVEVDNRKRHPMDFALWKAAKPGEPAWDSPFGKGRPGWHIECSTMSLKYLGEKFDFHGGGADLIFPHHENEIAQSCATIGDDNAFAQYWLHNGFITIDNSKMSKSAGNFFTVEDILKKYPGEVVRFFLLQTHYRSPLDFSEDRIKETQIAYNRLKTAYKNLHELVKKIEADEFIKDNQTAMLTLSQAGGLVETAERLMSAFDDAMNDDFNTALAISYMFELAKDINSYHNDYISGKIQPRGADAFMIMRVSEIFTDMASTIGIFENIEDEENNLNSEMVDKLLEIIISIRQDARKNKNWAVADKIRDDLKAAGIILEDTPQGVKWKQA